MANNDIIVALAFSSTGLSPLFASALDREYISTDKGGTWTRLNYPAMTWARPITVSGSTVLLGLVNGGLPLYHGIMRSTDNGASWTMVTTGVLDSIGVQTFTQIPASAGGTCIVAGTGLGGILLSKDTGASWTVENSNLTGKVNSTLFALAGWTNAKGMKKLIAGTYDGAYLSDDYGAHWNAANTGLPQNSMVCCFATSPNGMGGANIFVGIRTFPDPSFNGVYESIDDGATWVLANSGLPNTELRSLIVHGKYLFAGTDLNGMWKVPLK